MAQNHKSEREKILLIDDDKQTHFLVRSALKDYEIISAYEGVEALTKFIVSRPDLVLLDVHMPNVDGLEVLRQFQAAPEVDVPVVCVSSRDSSLVRRQIYEMGAIGFISKPFNPETLSSEVAHYLRSSHTFYQSEDKRIIFHELFSARQRLNATIQHVQELCDQGQRVLLVGWQDGEELFRNREHLLRQEQVVYLQCKPELVLRFSYLQNLKPLVSDMRNLVAPVGELKYFHLVFDEMELLFNLKDHEFAYSKAYQLAEALTNQFKSFSAFGTRPRSEEQGRLFKEIGTVLTKRAA